MKHSTLSLPIVMSIALVLSACSPAAKTPIVAPTKQPAKEATTVQSPVAVNSVVASTSANEQNITIEAGAFYYKPNVINAKVGQKITILFDSKDMMHDFNIDELSVKGPMVKGGATDTFSFTPDKKGTFEFYCSIGQHRANGQVGTIVIE